MFAELKHTLRRLRGQIIGWGLGLALYGLLMASLFDSIAGIEGFAEMIAKYPPELMAFFGDMMAIATPRGYLDIYYFTYAHLIVGIFVIGASASLVVGQEEKGILDLVMAHPVSRRALFWGRFLGLVTATALILVVAYLSWLVPSWGTGFDLTWIELLRPFAPLLAVLLLFSTLALLLSLVLPSTRVAGMVTGGVLVANWLLLGLANINQDLKVVIKYTPLHYYEGGKAITAVNLGWLAGLVGASLVLALLAWWRFDRRDIRVGGEGGWNLPKAWFPGRRLAG